jgi:hypothetical protein
MEILAQPRFFVWETVLVLWLPLISPVERRWI